MRVLLLFPLIVAACTAPAPPVDDLRARQEAACTAVIAEHVGRPPGEVTARRVSAEGGTATVEARDGERLHLCTVDDTGRVLGYSHPRG